MPKLMSLGVYFVLCRFSNPSHITGMVAEWLEHSACNTESTSSILHSGGHRARTMSKSFATVSNNVLSYGGVCALLNFGRRAIPNTVVLSIALYHLDITLRALQTQVCIQIFVQGPLHTIINAQILSNKPV